MELLPTEHETCQESIAGRATLSYKLVIDGYRSNAILVFASLLPLFTKMWNKTFKQLSCQQSGALQRQPTGV